MLTLAHPYAGRMASWGRVAASAAGAGAMTVAYAAGVERRRWTLREATLPVLVPGSRPLRLLHVSDLHMTPGQTSKQRWVAELAEHLRFFQESPDLRLVGFRPHRLERQMASQVLIESEVHLAHTALAQASPHEISRPFSVRPGNRG